MPEFKFNSSNHAIKQRVLNCIAKCDADIFCSVLRKEQLARHLRENPHIVYNFLMGSTISNIVRYYGLISTVKISVDKSLNEIHRDAFNQYIIFSPLQNIA